MMIHAPATGEHAALRGFLWQYDHIAALVYDSLTDDSFDTLRLVDPDAGRVDDLVLIRHGRTDGYQFKSAEFGSSLTFDKVVSAQHTGGFDSAPSLLWSLADGWKRLQSRSSNVHVHLVTEQHASVNDRLGNPGEADRPSPDHFSAFLTHVLEPLRSGKITLDDVGAGWQPALARLLQASGLEQEDFDRFLRSLHFDVGAGSGIPASQSTPRSDIIALWGVLSRCVSEAASVVELDRDGVLDLMGWRNRPRLRSRHGFPVDLDTYAPLAGAIEELGGLVSRHNRGYVAVVGPRVPASQPC